MTEIEIREISKSYGGETVVNGVSFTVSAGRVTAFLGPNGAGKTTTLRCLLGLVRPDHGIGLIGGSPYTSLPRPAQQVGAVLEATNLHPGRTVRKHLWIMCVAGGLPVERVDQVLAEVDLLNASRKRIGALSLGMRQRLALAGALLGDPKILILDEPANGLDPAGIEWLRHFLRHQAHDRGVAVLVSSHVLAEVEHTADDIVVIAEGRTLYTGSLADLTAPGENLHEAFLKMTSSPSAQFIAGGTQ